MTTLNKLFLIITALVVSCNSIVAADSLKTVRFAYDVDFDMNFDNRELYRSNFSRSMTIFAARLTPSIGLSVKQNAKTSHRVMLGADIIKDFGGTKENLLNELTLYYHLQKKLRKTDLSLYAGVFPRRMMSDRYSTAFYSDSLAFYDNNLEGLLLRFNRPRAEFEVGCDWMGQYGSNRRERFVVFSSGEGKVASMLTLGYAGYMYHYANSDLHKGVVDNILINPYLRFEFGHSMGLQRFSMRLGWVQAMQHDRVNADGYVFPGGGEFDLEIRKWDIGLYNHLFYGSDLMPYYNNKDNAGDKYGSSLYLGDPFYRIFDDAFNGYGLYDRMEFFYEPSFRGVPDFLKVRIAAIFHFNSVKYCGCQQMVVLKFNLQSLLGK